MRKILVFILCLILAGCSTTQTFSRVRGTKWAKLNGIRIYNSQPPTEYSFKSLGVVSAQGKGITTLVRLDDGLVKITLKAKELGANAIINWKIIARFGWVMDMEGEAVFFDKFPSALND